jgi:hypothetical protein
MTPCVIEDGDICYAEKGPAREPICVGCERTPDQTGVPRPKVWPVEDQRSRRKR